MPTDVVDTYNYPTIPLISTEPPCTPELSEDICDIRCPRDSSCSAQRLAIIDVIDPLNLCNLIPPPSWIRTRYPEIQRQYNTISLSISQIPTSIDSTVAEQNQQYDRLLN